jgi:site-specific DNA-methyltransferase (adenine-specific)
MARRDSVIPFEPMWAQLKRIIKPRGAIVLFGSQPFTSALIMSNVKMFKYCWVWNKKLAGNFALSNHQPLKITEDIIVFSDGRTAYNPQTILRDAPIKQLRGRGSGKGAIVAGYGGESHIYTHRQPQNIIVISNATRRDDGHPTQKPVKLMEYLIKTYTLEDETVLDFTMGSGSTGVAAKNTGRNFIGIEQDEGYYETAQKRIAAAVRQLEMFA